LKEYYDDQRTGVGTGTRTRTGTIWEIASQCSVERVGLDDYDDEYGEYGDYDGYAYADIGDYDGDRIATVIVVAAYGDYDGYAYDLDDDDYYGFDENAQENAIAFADSRDEWLAGCGSTRWIRMDRVQRCGAVEWSGVQWSG